MSVKIPKPKNQAWRKQEQRLDDEGARRVPGSGAGVRKGDNRGDQYLVEAKTTRSAQFILRLGTLVKVCREAAREDRLPVLQVQLRNEVRVAVLPWEHFEELLEAAGRKL